MWRLPDFKNYDDYDGVFTSDLNEFHGTVDSNIAAETGALYLNLNKYDNQVRMSTAWFEG